MAQDRFTKWSIVFDSQQNLIHFQTLASAKRKTINLTKLNFAPESTVLMLDVNSDFEGPAATHFEKYSREKNVEMLKTNVSKTGFKIPDFLITLAAGYPETTRPAKPRSDEKKSPAKGKAVPVEESIRQKPVSKLGKRAS